MPRDLLHNSLKNGEVHAVHVITKVCQEPRFPQLTIAPPLLLSGTYIQTYIHLLYRTGYALRKRVSNELYHSFSGDSINYY